MVESHEHWRRLQKKNASAKNNVGTASSFLPAKFSTVQWKTFGKIGKNFTVVTLEKSDASDFNYLIKCYCRVF